MSCVFILAPLVLGTGGFPVICAAAATAAASLGYKKLAAQKQTREQLEEVEISLDRSEIISGGMAEDEKMVMTKDGIQVEFYKDSRGRFAIHVRGKSLSKTELQNAGKEIINRLQQQLTYQKVMTELEKRGYKLTQESVDESKRIHIKLERSS